MLMQTFALSIMTWRTSSRSMPDFDIIATIRCLTWNELLVYKTVPNFKIISLEIQTKIEKEK